jgi:hypothetical protein
MTDPSVSTDPVPLATAADFTIRYPNVAQMFDPLVIEETMVEATSVLETMVNRRLSPFTNLVYEDRLEGLDPMEYGANSDLPLPFSGSLGLSFANALGADGLVRHFWLDHFAPFYPELWTYDLQSIVLTLTYGNKLVINLPQGIIDGPAKTDGHVWLQIGTFAPEGTRVTATYSGGYTVGIPPALKRACIFQAAELLIRDTEPQNRGQLSTEALEGMIIKIMAPWARA